MKESEGVFRGMLDHSRMAVCMFMISVIVVNPFGRMLEQFPVRIQQGPSMPSRTILNYFDG